MITSIMLLTALIHFILPAAPGATIVSSVVTLDFEPEEATILVKDVDGQHTGYRALPFLMRKEGTGTQAAKTAEWLIGTVVKTRSDAAPESLTLFLRGAGNQTKVIAGLSLDSPGVFIHSVGSEDIKQKILKQRQILESWLVQSKAQEDNLRRIRADAEIIGSLSRIAETEEEIEILKSEIENLDRDLDLLRDRFSAVKNLEAPQGYLRRELELSRHSADLLKVARAAEESESSRKALSQSELHRKLELVEKTRFEDEEKLRAELIRLKKQDFGSAGSISSSEPSEPVKNYWDLE